MSPCGPTSLPADTVWSLPENTEEMPEQVCNNPRRGGHISDINLEGSVESFHSRFSSVNHFPYEKWKGQFHICPFIDANNHFILDSTQLI